MKECPLWVDSRGKFDVTTVRPTTIYRPGDTGRFLMIHRRAQGSFPAVWSRRYIGKAMRELGYRPTVGIDEGLKRTVDWYPADGYLR